MRHPRFGLIAAALFPMWGIHAATHAQENKTPVPVEKTDPKIERANADLTALSSALKMYKMGAGAFPTEKQGLSALVVKPALDPVPRRWTQLIMKVPVDPWGRDYRYITRTKDQHEQHVIISGGPDEKDPGDDISRVMED